MAPGMAGHTPRPRERRLAKLALKIPVARAFKVKLSAFKRQGAAGRKARADAADESPRCPAPERTFEPGELIEGCQAECYSEADGCWLPCAVVHIDPESGAVRLDVNPAEALSPDEQRRRLQPRARPSTEQLEWVANLLREGRLDEEARGVLVRHSEPGPGGVDDELGLTLGLGAVAAAGAELDAKLGAGTAALALRRAIEQRGGQGLGVEELGQALWELAWGVQQSHGQALRRAGAGARSHGGPREVFDFGRTLGEGSYGIVKLATVRASGEKRAVKIVRRSRQLTRATDELADEVERLRGLDHPHIVKLYGHHLDASSVYLVMDYCSGGELYGLIRQRRISERLLPLSFTAEVMRQLMMAISHLHARGMVHLDLKSNNIMLTASRSTLPPGRSPQGSTLADVSERPHVMVIDLGLAQIFRPGNFRCYRPKGTPATMAPEAWQGVVHPKADVFSCGVVLFELLTLTLPFTCGYNIADAKRYWASRPQAPWRRLRPGAAGAGGLCRRMLALTWQDRPAAADCLQSPFLQPGVHAILGPGEAPVPRDVVQRLLDFPQRSMLYRCVALSIAQVWPSNQLPTIKRLFHGIDAEKAGRLTRHQLEAAFANLGADPSRGAEAAQAMDLNRDGMVSWTEFVAACIDLGAGTFEGDLRRLFDEADTDHDGLLRQDDVVGLLRSLHFCDEAAVVAREAFAELLGHSGREAGIDWDAFRRHFRTGRGPASGGEGGHGHASDAAEAPEAARSSSGILEQACTLLERTKGLFTVPAEEEAPPLEEALRQLAEMGLSDRGRCEAVLRRYRNRLSHLVIDELMADDEPIVASGNAHGRQASEAARYGRAGA